MLEHTNDLLDFLIDDSNHAAFGSLEPWKILIVDDDPDVHSATQYALAGFRFLGRGVNWLSAYSAKEARLLLEHEKGIALLFLDVVMEHDNAGLEFARWYREQGINPCTRIILRTGQPGQMPERQVIMDYDLHDYKNKTEMTADKLFTTTVSALRSYHDMTNLADSSRGMESVLRATNEVLKISHLETFGQRALDQLYAISGSAGRALLLCRETDHGWKRIATAGDFTTLPPRMDETLSQLSDQQEIVRKPSLYVQRLTKTEQRDFVIYIEPKTTLTEIQLDSVALYCNNLAVGLTNIQLYDSVIKANQVTVMSLAQITESRDHDTGEHVFRIAHLCQTLGQRLLHKGIYPHQLTRDMMEYLALSSTLHDVGKVSIRDNILLKPGKLTEEEFNIMKTHTTEGASMLRSIEDMTEGNTPYLELGERIAHSHHERWDGSGYPHGLAGEDIPVEARIVAIVDVFDALTHQRCYKPAFSTQQALEMIEQGRETQFDPVICDEFLSMMAEQAAESRAQSALI